MRGKMKWYLFRLKQMVEIPRKDWVKKLALPNFIKQAEFSTLAVLCHVSPGLSWS